MTAIFCLNNHFFNFITLRISHVLELFDNDELFSSEATKQLQKLNVYIQKAFKLRQEHMSV